MSSSKITPVWDLRSQTKPREKDKTGSGQEAETQTEWAGPWAEVFLLAPVKGKWALNSGGCTDTTGETAGGAERVG